MNFIISSQMFQIFMNFYNKFSIKHELIVRYDNIICTVITMVPILFRNAECSRGTDYFYAFWEPRWLVRYNTNRHFCCNINRCFFFPSLHLLFPHSDHSYQTPLSADTDPGYIKKQRVNEVHTSCLPIYQPRFQPERVQTAGNTRESKVCSVFIGCRGQNYLFSRESQWNVLKASKIHCSAVEAFSHLWPLIVLCNRSQRQEEAEREVENSIKFLTCSLRHGLFDLQ